jgi:signal transduction histidine kinase
VAHNIAASAFVQRLPVAAWTTDPDGTLLYANPRFYTWINKQSDETGTPIYDHLNTSLADSYRAATKRVLAENARVETYIPAPRPDGKLAYLLVHLFPIKNENGPTLIGGAAFDMSDVRVAAARESFENADKEALINNTTDMMWSYDTDLNFITANNAFKTSFFNRFQEGIIRGEKVLRSDILTPDEYAFWSFRYRETLLGRSIQEEVYQEEEDRWVLLTFNPIYQNNTIVGGTCLAKTITAQKKAELERKALIEELQRSNDDMRQFTYMVSHDLRTPVRNLQMVASMLKDEWLAEGEARDLMKILRETSARLSETLQNQIELMMVKDHKRVVVEELAFEAVYNKIYVSIEQLILAADARITVNFARAPRLHFSALYLESIFLNLLSNSLKYARKGVPPRIEIWTQATEAGTLLTVRDNGKGFDKEKVKGRLFGLNQRFHGNSDSSGVGLYIVHSQVTALGGSITAEAKENEGATFAITFPAGSNL